MNSPELIASYSYIADLMSATMCIAILFVFRYALFFTEDKKFTYVKRTVHYVLWASLINILFYVVCINFPDYYVLIFMLRTVYHVLLMSGLFLYIMYLLLLLNVDAVLSKKIKLISNVVFLVLTILELSSPFTHFGFFYQNGLWSDARFIKPFTVIYVFAIACMCYIVMVPGKNMIKSIRVSLVVVEIMDIALLIYGGILNTNSMTCFTFIMPILVVVILVHSKPYDLTTGVQDERSFESYLLHTYKKGYSIDYMALRLDLRVLSSIPKEVGRDMYTFWHSYFKDAIFFRASDGTFILAVSRSPKNGDTEHKMKELFFEVFPKHYERFQIHYNIVGLPDVNFIQKTEDLDNCLNYVFESMNSDETLIADEKMMESLKTMNSVVSELADIERKHDLSDERVIVHCQPIRNVKSNSFDTAESLMRLKLFDGTVISPVVFIPIAEKFGYIHSLSLIMLNKVCAKLRMMIEAGKEIKRISVNFSVQELREPNFCEEIIEIIKKNRVPFEKIGIELTESRNDNDYTFVKEKIATLKSYGICIYLDDFGTGYSNFDKILRLGLDVIKFDRSLLLCADTDENVRFTLIHFSQAFKELKYRILFEGVETSDQENLCIDCDADFLQGYKYSKPIPIDEIDPFFNQSSIS